MSDTDDPKTILERARAQMQAAPPPPAPPEEPAKAPAPVEDAGEEESFGGKPLRELRAAAEKKCRPIDIASFFQSGVVEQQVEILPGRLVVIFRTSTPDEESWANRKLFDLGRTSDRIWNQTSVLLSLAVGIASINGTRWPATTNQSGDLNASDMETRLKRAGMLSTPISMLLSLHLAWFTERVNAALSLEAVKNG